MQTNDTTDKQAQQPLTDCEDWQLAFKPFDGHPSAALSFGYNVAILRTYLDGQLIKSRPVVEALDLAMEVLFPYTSFHNASFELFIRLTQGKLTLDEEQMLDALGLKF